MDLQNTKISSLKPQMMKIDICEKTNLSIVQLIWYQKLTESISSQFIFCGLSSQNLNDSDIEAISHRLRKWTKAIRDDKKQELLVND